MERTLHDVPMDYIEKPIPGIPVVSIWIGQQNRKFLAPQKDRFQGICPSAYTAMFNEICKKYSLICDTSNVTPKIDYSMFDIHKIDKFLSTIRKPCVIVSNTQVLSGQAGGKVCASPTYMDFIIDHLKPHFTVVTTKDRRKEGEYFIGNIVRRSDEDLSELSYLSTKSYGIIGRSSGPYVFSIVEENFNGPLQMICLTLDKEGVYWETATNTHWLRINEEKKFILTQISKFLNIGI